MHEYAFTFFIESPIFYVNVYASKHEWTSELKSIMNHVIDQSVFQLQKDFNKTAWDQ